MCEVGIPSGAVMEQRGNCEQRLHPGKGNLRNLSGIINSAGRELTRKKSKNKEGLFNRWDWPAMAQATSSVILTFQVLDCHLFTEAETSLWKEGLCGQEPCSLMPRVRAEG